MKLPFVSRERYSETKAMLEQRIAELESERQKLWDVLAYNAIHMTIFNKDLIPQPMAELEPELTEEQKAEEAMRAIERDEIARLKATMRTRPSQLARVTSEIYSARAHRAAAAAMPAKVKPEVQSIFDSAKAAVAH